MKWCQRNTKHEIKTGQARTKIPPHTRPEKTNTETNGYDLFTGDSDWPYDKQGDLRMIDFPLSSSVP